MRLCCIRLLSTVVAVLAVQCTKENPLFAFASPFYQAFPSIGCSHNHKGSLLIGKRR